MRKAEIKDQSRERSPECSTQNIEKPTSRYLFDNIIIISLSWEGSGGLFIARLYHQLGAAITDCTEHSKQWQDQFDQVNNSQSGKYLYIPTPDYDAFFLYRDGSLFIILRVMIIILYNYSRNIKHLTFSYLLNKKLLRFFVFQEMLVSQYINIFLFTLLVLFS